MGRKSFIKYLIEHNVIEPCLVCISSYVIRKLSKGWVTCWRNECCYKTQYKNNLINKNMEIDVNKITNAVTDNHFETIHSLVKANQNIIEALQIMQSTIENFEDAECLKLNKERMINYFKKFSK